MKTLHQQLDIGVKMAVLLDADKTADWSL